ncbi:type IV pilus biogenesis protein PilM [Pseudoneobacillus sp. C159]
MFNTKRIANLIFNDHSIRFVEAKTSPSPTPTNWGEKILPQGIIHEGKIIDSSTFSMILEECIQDWGISRRKVRFLVPDPLVMIRKIKIPDEIQPDELVSYLFLEIGSSIHLPFEDPVFDSILLPEKEGKKEAILFAAPEHQVKEYSSILTDLKLKPIAADISPLALYRLYFQTDNASANERLMMIQFDIDRVFICIFEQQYPIFMHQFPFPFHQDDWELRETQAGFVQLTFIGDVSSLAQQLEDYYKEVQKLMDFYQYSLYQGNQQLSKILLNGDHPLLAVILDEMKERFTISIGSITLSQIGVQHFPPSHFLALGLAIKEV